MSRLRGVQGGRLDDLLSAAAGAREADHEMRRQIQQNLSPRLYSMIGLLVAGLLGCEKFAANLRGPLDGATAEQIARDWMQLSLPEAERAVLSYAQKGTIDEASMRRDDIEALRAAGFSDKDVLVIATAIAYHNYSIRLAAAFDVTPL